MSSVIGRPSCQVLASTTRPYRKAPMTTALTSYTTPRDIIIGLARAEAKLTLANLAYNFDRLIFHERRAMAG
jgi:hypothetical protein